MLNEGNVVLDPFCGCGTTIAAAQKLNRQWIGIDITHLSIALQKYRLKDAFGLEPVGTRTSKSSPPYEGGVAAASADGVVLSSSNDRSTIFMLERLKKHGSLKKKTHDELVCRIHGFLSALDHNLRLTVGRTTRVPLANHSALATIATRMGLNSAADLLEPLTLHRLAVGEAFENILE